MSDRLTFWLNYLFLACLSIWLGSMIFFAAVARIPFEFIASRHLAGNITSSMLARIDQSGPFLGGMLVVLAVVIAQRVGQSTGDIRWLIVTLVLMTAIPIVSGHFISPRLFAIRSAAPGGIIDNALANDPVRVAFNRLHRVSVTLLLVNIIFGMVALGAVVRLLVGLSRSTR